ncbi:hypothetical protein [Candidatus Methanarcanum hacksteinii]|uniref:hypothetical protein n=1 Tax=Candidatus Methanarcanum hacksteinii TaxID=2911857 RepID=UPI0037DC31D3
MSIIKILFCVTFLLLLSVLIFQISSSDATDDSALYVSESNRLQYIINSEFPIEEDEIVFNWQYSSLKTKTTNSSSTWTITSTPLIVGEYTYVACDDTIYKLKTSTGACVCTAKREFNGPSFYHYLGYGGNVIIDYNKGQLFDLDLKQFASLNKTIKGSWYHDGKHYVVFSESGSVLKLKALTVNSGDKNSIKYSSLNLDVTGWYGMYGQFSAPVFKDNQMYYISTTTTKDDSGSTIPDKIMLNWVNLESGEKKTLNLNLNGRYLDDGWLTLDGNNMYLPTYSSGLFNVGDERSAITCIKLSDGGGMKEEFTKFFDESGITSNFIVYNNRGYINVNLSSKESSDRQAKMYVFDMTTFGADSSPIYKTTTCYTHGGIVLNKYGSEENGLVHIYLVPYESGTITGNYLCMVEDGPNHIKSRMVSYKSASSGNSGAHNYSTQTIRAGAHGELLWYRDLGQVVCFTSIEDKKYTIFLEHNGDAKWVELTENELRGIGNSNITISDKTITSYSIDDSTVDNFKLYYYRDGLGWVNQFKNSYGKTITLNSTIGNSEGSAYRIINTSGGGVINYLILSDSIDAPSESDVYYNKNNGDRISLGSYLSDRNLLGVLLTKTEPQIVPALPGYSVQGKAETNPVETTITVTIEKKQDSVNLENPMLLVIAQYEKNVAVNVYSKVGPFIDNKVVEKVKVSSPSLQLITIDLVDGFQEGVYTSYGTYSYIQGSSQPKPEPDFMLNGGETITLNSGQVYRIDLADPRMFQELKTVRLLDMDEVEIPGSTVEVTDIAYPTEPVGNRYHLRFTLKIIAPSFDLAFLTDGYVTIMVKIVGNEPLLTLDESTVTTNATTLDSGKTYKIDYTYNGIKNSLGEMKVYSGNFEVIPDYTIVTKDVRFSQDSSGVRHLYFLLTVTGPSVESAYLTDGDIMFLVKIVGS